MTQPDDESLFEALDATWPAARVTEAGGFTIREGAGGGKRVSAASHGGSWRADGIPAAEAAMRRLGQRPLFMVRGNDAAFDQALAARGYRPIDPVVLYAAPVPALTAEVPRVRTFTLWPPLAIQREIWAEGGIGEARLAVMARAGAPRVSILGRSGDKPAGTAFVACHGTIAMVHALEVRPAMRRDGLGRHMMQAAANWAETQGAWTLALAVTRANRAANALYTSMGLAVVGEYHYRIEP